MGLTRSQITLTSITLIIVSLSLVIPETKVPKAALNAKKVPVENPVCPWVCAWTIRVTATL